MEEQQIQENQHTTQVTSEFECPICFYLMVEPIKLNCAHKICLNCVEQLLITVSKKCPLCRTAFEQNLFSFDPDIFRKLYTDHKDALLERFKKLYTERLGKRGYLEISVAYGNEHAFKPDEVYNKHFWKAFVRLKPSNNVMKSFLDGFKKNAQSRLYMESYKTPNDEALKSVLSLTQIKDEKQEEFSNFNPDDLDIIKRVTFNLHPTFNPPTVYVEEKPFEIQRLGWGTFTIATTIEFKDMYKLEPLNVDIKLSFTKPLTEQLHPIWISAKLD